MHTSPFERAALLLRPLHARWTARATRPPDMPAPWQPPPVASEMVVPSVVPNDLRAPGADQDPALDLPCALLIRPPVDAPQDLTAMELLIQALALARPGRTAAIALELVGQADARAIVARTTAPQTLDYLASQIHARYPQSDVQLIAPDQDAFCLHDGEAISARLLRPTGRPYLSLRTWTPPRGSRQEYQMGVDPLLGVLAALGPLPVGMRAIAQLALTPASPHWSEGHMREADEHSLARSRITAVSRDRESQVGSPLPLLILFGLMLALWWLLSPAHHADHYPLIGPFIRQLQSLLAPGSKGGGLSVSQRLTHLAQLLPIFTAWILGVGSGVLLLLLIVRRFLHLGTPAETVFDPAEIALKTHQPGYHTQLRLYVISPAGDTRAEEQRWHAQRQRVLERITATYRQFHRAGASSFTARAIPAAWARRLTPESPYWPGEHSRQRHQWRWGVGRSPTILSLAEIASLWHLPQAYDLPELAWVEQQNRAKTLFAPRAVRAEGDADGPHVVGTSRHAGYQTPITLGWESLRQHSLLVAKTGKGKSSLMLLLARLGLRLTPPAPSWHQEEPHLGALAPTPLGLILVDPHGDLAQQMLGAIPPSRQGDVILLDLADTEHPPAINPLDVTLGRNRDKAVENLLVIFADIWDKGWGYRMENAMEFALKTLYAANETLIYQYHMDPIDQFTLLDVTPLLNQDRFRHEVLKHVKDLEIHRWWETYFDKLYERLRLDVINPVQTKLNKFNGSIIARRILGIPQSTLDLTRVVREGKILIINTAQGVVGAHTARLIGATILGLLRVTLEEQAALATDERHRLLVLVDEFQTLQGVDFGQMLSELRKYGASFILATQALAYLDKLDPALRPTVLANIDNLFAFDMSAEDARLMERELDGVVTTRDLINLDAFTCYAKLTANGRRLPVFSFDLAAPPTRDDAASHAIRAESQRLLAPRTLAEIDTLLAELADRHPADERERGRANMAISRQHQLPAPPEEPGTAPLVTPARPPPPKRRLPGSRRRTGMLNTQGIGYGHAQPTALLPSPAAKPATSPPRRLRGKRGSGKGAQPAEPGEPPSEGKTP
ncbi:MAG: type IV secretion system DNA-binding domain-containing protein [Ktedonobacterales bacterium]|nr:type IV secretion system DNA-binding domain-containing protein [Ktedonobacterales bacterium]